MWTVGLEYSWAGVRSKRTYWVYAEEPEQAIRLAFENLEHHEQIPRAACREIRCVWTKAILGQP